MESPSNVTIFPTSLLNRTDLAEPDIPSSSNLGWQIAGGTVASAIFLVVVYRYRFRLRDWFASFCCFCYPIRVPFEGLNCLARFCCPRRRPFKRSNSARPVPTIASDSTESTATDNAFYAKISARPSKLSVVLVAAGTPQQEPYKWARGLDAYLTNQWAESVLGFKTNADISIVCLGPEWEARPADDAIVLLLFIGGERLSINMEKWYQALREYPWCFRY